MFGALAKKIFGTANERIIKTMHKDVEAINALEPKIASLSDTDLQAQTGKLRERLLAGESVDDILVEAFATMREAAKRTLGMRHFDVQLIGGMVLHRGMISEMRTGEGKTLVATLPAYLNALTGKGVHIVTVNDYLAKRDAAWMGKVYTFLGLSVGCITHSLNDFERKAAYSADITYGTNNEFGFDYLRDNMKFTLEQMVQRPFNYAIVDEVDSILIDEARTPLIISGPTEDNSELYIKVDKLIPLLTAEDYEVDEKARTVTMTDEGTEHIENLLLEHGLLEEGQGLYDIESISLVHHVNQALRAHKLFTADVDYIVKDNKVIIIDEFTGRMMEGRRFSEGLHQALEAKENAAIQNENQTLASITFQNYFRLYPKLAGMTGTAMTEAGEFHDIYKLDVVEIPTHMSIQRQDDDDEIYRTAEEKYEAVIALIEERYKAGQPILLGTVSIEKSEYLSKLLKKKKIPHNVLNARHHEQEAHIISQAGRPGRVTIATNMAGRGTDIMLGGNPEMRIADEVASHDDDATRAAKIAAIKAEVEKEKQQALAAGGLFVIGSERHESRRIDNQLRGRSGRQGDPGRTKFFLSLEDDLMRIFGSERIGSMLEKLGLQKGEAIYHPWITRALEKAQQKVEGRNYEIRKNLLKFDDVMNDQRKVVYEQRLGIMHDEEITETIQAMQEEVSENLIENHIPPRAYPEEWDTESLQKDIFRVFGLNLPVADWAQEEGIADKELLARLQQAVTDQVKDKEELYSMELLQEAQKRILLLTLDQLWKEHLHSLDHLRQGINLRAYAQKDPLNEYKREAFEMFQGMLESLRESVIGRLSHLEINFAPGNEASMPFPQPQQIMHESRIDPAMAGNESPDTIHSSEPTPLRAHIPPEQRDPNDPMTWGKISRNEVCPCGSGKKYKHCHGQLVA